MRTLIRNNKAVATVAGGALVVMTAGAAYAYWSTAGSGTGSATTASVNGTLTLTSGALSGAVTPGSSRTFDIFATNSGTTDLRLGGVIQTTVSSSKATCQSLIADYSVADVSSVTTVPASTTTPMKVATATLVYAQSATVNQDECKGAPLSFAFSTPAQ